MGKIVCLTNYNQYETKRVFAEELAKELRLLGHTVALFDGEKGMPTAAIAALSQERPDLIYTFHSLDPLPDGRYPWEVLSSPFFCILLDPAIYSLPIIQNSQCIVATIDKDDLATISSMGCKHSFFFPHAVDRELFSSQMEKKEWDAVFLGSCYDYFSIEEQWKKAYPKKIRDMLYDAAEYVFADNRTSLYRAFITAIEEYKVTPDQVNFHDAFYEWDIYVRGKERIEMLRAFSHMPLHVFGDVFEAFPGASRGFDYYLQDKKNITVHPCVSYKDSFAVQRKAKFTLNSSSMYKNGSHERLFTPAPCSSLLVTSDGVYVREIFSEEEIVINPPHGACSLEEKVQKIASDEALYEQMLSNYRKKVLNGHTWKQRAELIEQHIFANNRHCKT